MIKEDYVSFEVAKILKEKGFDEYCGTSYTTDDGYPFRVMGTTYSLEHNSDYDQYHYSMPTLSFAMKWLREVHKIHINIDIHWLHFANQNGWMYVIEKILDNGIDYIDSKGDENDKSFYSTYEEAVEAALLYALKNLILI